MRDRRTQIGKRLHEIGVHGRDSERGSQHAESVADVILRRDSHDCATIMAKSAGDSESDFEIFSGVRSIL